MSCPYWLVWEEVCVDRCGETPLSGGGWWRQAFTVRSADRHAAGPGPAPRPGQQRAPYTTRCAKCHPLNVRGWLRALGFGDFKTTCSLTTALPLLLAL